MKREQLIKEAIEILESDKDIFINCVNELDSYNGFANEWRCYPMEELDDWFYGCKPSEFLNQIDFEEFDINDNYFQETIWGIQSTNDVYDAYTQNVDAGELFDNLLMEYCHLDINYIDSALDELLERIDNEDYDEE